jgi:hypothetical protein
MDVKLTLRVPRHARIVKVTVYRGRRRLSTRPRSSRVDQAG